MKSRLQDEEETLTPQTRGTEEAGETQRRLPGRLVDAVARRKRDAQEGSCGREKATLWGQEKRCVLFYYFFCISPLCLWSR